MLLADHIITLLFRSHLPTGAGDRQFALSLHFGRRPAFTWVLVPLDEVPRYLLPKSTKQ